MTARRRSGPPLVRRYSVFPCSGRYAPFAVDLQDNAVLMAYSKSGMVFRCISSNFGLC